MKKILYVSEYIPYPKIPHAGGQTLYYYFYNLMICHPHDFDITLIGACTKEEAHFIDNCDYNANVIKCIIKGTFIADFCRKLFNVYGKIIKKSEIQKSYYKTYLILQKVKHLAQNGYQPNVIILEWTEMVILAKTIKKYFPLAKIIASEHDVTYVRYLRLYENAATDKALFKKKYELVKKEELTALDNVDVIMPQSIKDKERLIDVGVDKNKIYVNIPFYKLMNDVARNDIKCQILFWGAMYRQENYEAALWFIDNVLPSLNSDIKFIVAGNKPPKILEEKKSERVVVTGYVEDVSQYFSTSMCFVAPLKNGAGIKVKVLEALSSGIPVLTNDVGIEGIPAINGEHYFHCNDAKNYIKIIDDLYKHKINTKSLSEKQKDFIKKNFNLLDSFYRYQKLLAEL